MQTRPLIFIAALGAALPLTTHAQQANPMQQCTSHSDCAVVESRCNGITELLPLNRSYIDEMAEISGPLCNLRIRETGVLAPACVTGSCRTQTAALGERVIVREYVYEPSAAYPDYSAIARDLDEELELVVPEDDTGGEFTAYDLPDEVVRQQQLAELELERQ